MPSMFHHDHYTAEFLTQLKGAATTPLSISVGLPARNEATTIGTIVEQIYTQLVVDNPLVDQLLVLDDGSTDDTAAIARSAGATVYPSASISPEYDREVGGVRQGGKGEALWKLLKVSNGDLLVWCDADIRNFDPRFVLGCLGPLLTQPEIGFIKGYYQRPLRDDGEGGGRVTELVARPLISTLFPELGHIVQPLSGEFGGRREILEAVPFSRGYAVDLALLIDVSRRFGVETIGQVDLGTRIHRNRPLRQLGPQAAAILAMAYQKADGKLSGDELDLLRPTFGDHRVQIGELPALRPSGVTTGHPDPR